MAPSHISLEQRKGIALRLMALPVVQQQEARLLQAGAESELRVLQEQIVFLSAKATKSPDNERLDSNLKTLAEELHQRASPELSGQFGPLLSPIVTQLTAQMTSLSCCTCSCMSGVVCDGGADDDTLVAGGGLCIASLSHLFEHALAMAQTAFQDYLPNTPLPIVKFSTAHYNGKPHDIPVPYYCGGKTSFETDGESVVQLHLTPTALDWQTYLASLYVLVHECFCHAFSGARTGQRAETGNDDPFTEGWMDWLAHEVLLANQHRLSGLPASGSEFARIATIFTEKRSHYSRAPGAEPVSVHAKMCALGKTAALKMQSLFQRLPESQSNALATLLRLSCDILCAGFSLGEHEALVWSVNLGLPSQGEVESPGQFEQIPRIVRKYLKNNDVIELIDSFNDYNYSFDK